MSDEENRCCTRCGRPSCWNLCGKCTDRSPTDVFNAAQKEVPKASITKAPSQSTPDMTLTEFGTLMEMLSQSEYETPMPRSSLMQTTSQADTAATTISSSTKNLKGGLSLLSDQRISTGAKIASSVEQDNEQSRFKYVAMLAKESKSKKTAPLSSPESDKWFHNPMLAQFKDEHRDQQFMSSFESPGSGPMPFDSPSIDRASISISSASAESKPQEAESYLPTDQNPNGLSALDEPGVKAEASHPTQDFDFDVAGNSQRPTMLKLTNITHQQSKEVLETCPQVFAIPKYTVDDIKYSLSKVADTDKVNRKIQQETGTTMKKKLLLPRQRAFAIWESTSSDESQFSPLERPPKRTLTGTMKSEQFTVGAEVYSPTSVPAAVDSRAAENANATIVAPAAITEQPRMTIGNADDMLSPPFTPQVLVEGTAKTKTIVNQSDMLSPPFTPQVKEQGMVENVNERLPASNFFFGNSMAMAKSSKAGGDKQMKDPQKSPNEDGLTSGLKKKK